MDIDSKSLWFDPSFNEVTGGFFPAHDTQKRKIISLPLHDNVRKDMLILLCRSIVERKVPGAIAELGVYRGETAKLFHHYLPERKFYLFDTFEGFDKRDVQTELVETGMQTTAEHFSSTGVDRALRIIEAVNGNIEIIQGYFPESTQGLSINEPFALVHLDADLYQPTKAGLEFFYPKLEEGGILIVHDYNAWSGARKAVDEYCHENNLFPIPMPDKSGSCLLIKFE